jgi:surfeit locus 1 family protein
MNARLRFVLVTLAALGTAALTARLGLWQLDRAAQKVALQASIDARMHLPPLDAGALATTVRQAEAQHFREVMLAGRWSPSHTVYLDNRQDPAGRSGFIVVTPLVLADGRAVLVQRGWLARDAQDRTRLPALRTPEGDVTVAGRLAPPPAKLFEFESGDRGLIRQNLDLDAFARETGLRLVPTSVQQAGPSSPADGLQRDWPVPGSGVATHYGYAFQWFGLSALVLILYVWFQLIQPRRALHR